MARWKEVRTLLDLREFPVQHGAMAENLRHYLDSDSMPSAKTAIVMTSALLKLQAGRIATSAHRQYFTYFPDAETWIGE